MDILIGVLKVLGIIVLLIIASKIEFFIELLFAVIGYVPKKIWGFLDQKKRLITTWLISLALCIAAICLNSFKIEIYGGFYETLIGIFCSILVIIPLVKFLERLVYSFGEGRMPFWIGHTRYTRKDFTIKDHGADFLLNWLTVPVLLPAVGFFFFSVIKLIAISIKALLTIFK